MQPTPPNPPDKEEPFLPWLETQGHPGPASVMKERMEYPMPLHLRQYARRLETGANSGQLVTCRRYLVILNGVTSQLQLKRQKKHARTVDKLSQIILLKPTN